MRQLQGYAELAEPALRQALVGETRWERKRRLENLLLQIGDEMHSSWLQQKRGIEVLEKLDDPGAAALLEELSRGHPNARLTEDAHASLERWRRTK
jgi:hypothetical protein